MNTQEIALIGGKPMKRIVYNGNTVITLPMVDKVHQRPEGTAKRAFLKFRDRFIAGEDYYELSHETWSNLVGRNTSHQEGKTSRQDGQWGGHRGNMYFLTLSGYLMLVKSFTDELSWNVQRMLVKSYFKATETVEALKEELLDAYRLIKQLSRRKGNKVQAADNSEILKLKKQGLPTSQICEKTGWSPTTVKKHVADARQLGLFDLPQLA